jgi:hypothetical protein
MKLLTGNHLVNGYVIWWTGEGWSRHVEQAVDVGDKGELIAQTETAACRVNNPYIVDAEPGPTGPVPLHIKERIRATGPTVRPDLILQPADKSAGSYVI